MNIQPIVEGHGETEAVPVLLRRLIHEAGAYGIGVSRPIRRRRPELIQKIPLEKAVRLALLQPDCSAILIIFDADDDCPRDVAPTIESWANPIAGGTPCGVVIANREFESWFIAAIESLRGRCGIREDAISHPEPEIPRGAKGQLELRMKDGESYSETVDQARLTAAFDLGIAYKRCRSFRKMIKVFGLLALGVGAPIHTWPPVAWGIDVGELGQ